MGKTIAQKIIASHLVSGDMTPGSEVALRIDQTLTQDATGTMAYLEFETMGIPRVKTEMSIAYVDHNTLQCGFENSDDHRYLQTVTAKHGVYFSRPGNGICHQVHLERFGAPGKTLIGSDSHTPTGGGIGMLAFGAGGLDVAVAMGGGAYYIPMPKMVRVNLTGKLSPWVSAKDVILDVLRQMTVKGGVGKIVEYAGEGVKTLSVPERATITNMGAELGATTSIFPSDEATKKFLEAQGRGDVWVPLSSDPDAEYDEEYTVDLSALEPLAAMPHMPDNVKKVSEIGEIKVNQCCIGSCTNSSYYDMMKVASILKGKTVSPEVSLTISPGSKQVFNMLAQNGALADIIFLVSPEVAAASALTGVLTDPRTLGEMPEIEMPEHFTINDNMIVKPAENPAEVEVVRGPNIKPFPLGKALEASYTGKVVLKTEDNITTDHILPAGAKLLPYRSNVPYYSNYCFINVDPEFPSRCKEQGGGVIVGGANYGQGSSREHAALVPLYLGVKAVLCKSFARIHKANLVNSGIIPLTFADPADYDAINLLDEISLPNVLEEVKNGEQVTVVCGGKTFKADCEVSERQRHALLAGGTLLYARQQNK